MGDSRRIPATKIIDGDICPVYYDPSLYRQAKEFVPEEGDIIEVSYPRCGTHLVQQLIQLIVNGGRSAKTFLEFNRLTPTIEICELQDAPTSPRILRTHLPINKQRFSEKAKYVYVARNPWDCCVSGFHMIREYPVFQFADARFEDYLDAFLRGELGYGNYFDHVLSGYGYRNYPNVFFLTYEEIRKNKADVILRLAQFLGEDYRESLLENEHVLEQVAEKSELAFMKDLIPTNVQNIMKAFPRVLGQVNALHLSSEGRKSDSLAEANLVRKGDIGGWKSLFSNESTDKMRATINQKFGKTSIMNLWEQD